MRQKSLSDLQARQHWGLILLVLVALGLRLWDLWILPPGLYYDEAFDGLDALRIALGGYFPVYLPGNNGREPLYMYLVAIFIKVLGPTAYTLRFTSAMIGVLTVPAVYFAAHSILHDLSDRLYQTSHSRFVAVLPALVAAAGIAVSFPHLSLSRLALRVILLPLLSALAIGFFWRAWSRLRYRDFFWSGVSMALALYAYTAARLLPVVVALFVLIELAVDGWHNRADLPALWRQWRVRIIGLGVMILVGALLLTPFLLFFLNNGALFSARAADVSVFSIPQADMAGTPSESIVHNLVLVAQSFYMTGDENPRHNLPGRPVNDPLLAILFTLGWLACLYWIKKSWARLLLLWLTVMLLPTILSDLAPHALRGAGALPPLALSYGVGAAVIVSLLLRIGQRAGSGVESAAPGASHRSTAAHSNIPILAGSVILIGVVAVSGTWTAIDYFGRWATQSKLGKEFDVDRQLGTDQVVDFLRSSNNGAILVSSNLFVQPQMAYALGKVHLQSALPETISNTLSSDLAIPVIRETDFDPRQSMYLLSRDGNSLVVNWLQPISDQSETPPESSSSQSENRTWLRSPVHQPGWPEITISPLPGTVELSPRQIRYPLDVSFANGMRLVGYDVEPDTAQPGDADMPFRLTLFWRADTGAQEKSGASPDPAQDHFDVFAHLLSQGGVEQTRNGPIGEVVLLEWGDWLGADAIIEDVRFLKVPSDMPAGRAYFETGLYHYQPRVTTAKVDRIPILDGDGKPVLDAFELGAVLVGAAAPPVDLSDLTPVEVEFDHRIKLAGWKAALDPSNSRRLLVELGWIANDRSTTDYTSFVHLIDDEGQIQAQQDAPPGGLDNATHLWVPGETVRSTYSLDLPEDMVLSESRLRIGLYEPVSGKQLPVTATMNEFIAAPGASYVLLPVAQ